MAYPFSEEGTGILWSMEAVGGGEEGGGRGCVIFLAAPSVLGLIMQRQ